MPYDIPGTDLKRQGWLTKRNSGVTVTLLFGAAIYPESQKREGERLKIRVTVARVKVCNAGWGRKICREMVFSAAQITAWGMAV